MEEFENNQQGTIPPSQVYVQPSAPQPSPQPPKKKKSKKKIIGIIVAVIVVIGIFGGACSGESETDKINSKIETSQQADKDKEKEAAKEKSANADAQAGVDKSELEYACGDAYKNYKSADYTKKSYSNLQDAIEAGKKVLKDENASQADVDAANKAIEEAGLALVEAFNADSYKSVDYSKIARNPDKYLGQKLKFSGKVLQVVEGDGEVTLRVATDGAWDDVVLVAYKSDIISSRVLEEDMVVMYGKFGGLYTYQSTMGASISVPSMVLDKIKIK